MEKVKYIRLAGNGIQVLGEHFSVIETAKDKVTITKEADGALVSGRVNLFIPSTSIAFYQLETPTPAKPGK